MTDRLLSWATGFYKRWSTKHPEIWRHRGGQGEMAAIIWASLLPFLTCGVFVFVCAQLHLVSYGATLKFAFAVWLIGPLPLAIVNSLLHKARSCRCGASHSLGWLVKPFLAALSRLAIQFIS